MTTLLTKEPRALTKIIKEISIPKKRGTKDSIGMKMTHNLIPFNLKLKYFTYIISRENWVENKKADIERVCSVSLDLQRLNIFLLDPLNREKLLEILKVKDEFNLLTPLLYKGSYITIPIFCKEEISRLYSKLFSPSLLELLYIHEF